jgi:hypothetical protein
MGALACLACGEIANPTAPASPKLDTQAALSAPVNASYSRYILISGVWVCVDCEEIGK